MRYAILASASLIVSSIVVTNTYYRKKQFYPTVVYLTNNQPSLSILLFQCVVILFLVVKALTYAFFGRLQRAEVDNLVSQSWYAFFDMCLVFAFFQNELGVEFLFLFAILLFVRAFHWLIEERVDYMERSPVISVLFHLRTMMLITLLTLVDVYFIKTAYWKPATHGISVHLALGIEYFILILSLLSTTVRYILHSIDSMREHSWNKKATYLLYVDILIGFIRLAVYVEFTFIMWSLHPFPLFIARPIYLSIRSLKKAIRDMLMSRRAIRYMNTVFRDATPDDLASSSDTVCIICREEMNLQTDNTPSVGTSALKRLPCSHIFHFGCLRSWFQRQQTCPTCRMDVIREARVQERQRQQPHRSATTNNAQPDSSTTSGPSNSTTTSSVAANNQNLSVPWMPPANAFPFYPPFIPPTNNSTTTQAQTVFPSVSPLFIPPFMGMPIIYPGKLGGKFITLLTEHPIYNHTVWMLYIILIRYRSRKLSFHFIFTFIQFFLMLEQLKWTVMCVIIIIMHSVRIFELFNFQRILSMYLAQSGSCVYYQSFLKQNMKKVTDRLSCIWFLKQFLLVFTNFIHMKI
ncbi:unnamed protein product [Schistosoma spindalis]|nr:unnamed protein product [Schistosoma spindale]